MTPKPVSGSEPSAGPTAVVAQSSPVFEPSATAEQPASESSQPSQAASLPKLPQKRPADALYSTGAFKFFVDSFGEATLERDGEAFDMRPPFCRQAFYNSYLSSHARKQEMAKRNIHDDPGREDASSDDEQMTVSNNRTHSRQELKQLDPEIPWKEIVKLPRAAYQKDLESVRVKHDNWLSWGGVRPLSRAEVRKVMADPELSKRILKSRSAYRDKNKGLGEIKAKCRVVLIGCCDPDLFHLSRDSPTPSRLSESLVLAIATAGANGEMNNEAGRWSLWISDAKSAFLQREQSREERAGPLYMKAPRDPLILETGAFAADLYEVLGNGYGLPDAPRVWSRRVFKRALEKGFRQHAFDKCLFYFLDKKGRLRAVMIVHVDDFLCTFHQDFDKTILENLFVWGSVVIVDKLHPGTVEKRSR